ncbi:serine hydrolase [Mucisphaera calidilacus]|uniref:D-alanyl-D-alanine-carboxypeptidase/endopeptidase AmpH n=1 Tax=Mucisphaera calidilacus TaxID=2527982 RepID=A0A518BWP5_9BACT|nr:serine hydrolase [Mucisphaera calidilacus]QDU71391.1 D-alanyl-D-alanine-carboxypeptidase/endopeptidase AmpH precursor [Mucisphaera calidilacus]
MLRILLLLVVVMSVGASVSGQSEPVRPEQVDEPIAALDATGIVPRTDRVIDYEHLMRADDAVAAAMARGEIPGAVLCVGDSRGVFYRKAYGDRAVVPRRVGMGVNTVFDMASLTKPIATTASVLKLVDEGKIELDRPAADYLPALADQADKSGMTIRHLLLHHSGIPPVNSMSQYRGERDAMIRNVATCALRHEPGTGYAYSCLGFILLSEVVAEVSGVPFDRYAKENIFEPLGMTDSTFNPGDDLVIRTAPTEVINGEPRLGRVHDPRALALGGVSGNAGLFSTARDVSRFCRMLLNGGELDGVRVLSEEAVGLMLTAVSLPDGTGWRSLGLGGRGSARSSRGAVMDFEGSVGHTGYTGTAMWVDPVHDLFYVLLTNRVHPSDADGKAAPVRRDVATIVGGAVLGKPAASAEAVREMRFLTPRPRDLMSGTAHLPEGMRLSLPFRGSFTVEEGYGHEARWWTHKTIGRDGAANDFFALDFDLPAGTEVLAVAPGRVVTCQHREDGYGQYVVIDHGEGVTSIYAHLSERRFPEVAYGEPEVWVKRSEVIGKSGDSGTTWPHLHMSVHTGSRLSHSGCDVGGKATVPEPMGGYYGLRRGQVLVGPEGE